jgi:hypothetical protein
MGVINDKFYNSEKVRYNKAMLKFNEEMDKYNKLKLTTLEYINCKLTLNQWEPLYDYYDVDHALDRYNDRFSTNYVMVLPDKPNLSDYYTPSEEKINTKYLLLIIIGLLGGYIVYHYL